MIINISLSIVANSISRSPFAAHSGFSGSNAFAIKRSSFLRHFSTVFYSNSQNTRFSAKQTDFRRVLGNAVAFESNEYSAKNYMNHQNYLGPSLSFSDCTFSSCFANHESISLCGGAIFAQFGFAPKSYFSISRCGFDNCTALSSGGAFYAACSKVTVTSICVQLCAAQTNQAFFVHSTHSSITKSTAYYNGYKEYQPKNQFSYFVDPKVTVGLSSGAHFYRSNNMSLNVASSGVFAAMRDLSVLTVSGCFFAESTGKNGVNIYGSNNVTFDNCIFTNNHFMEGQLLKTTNPVVFSSCTFIIGHSVISPKKETKLLTFKLCYIDLSSNQFHSLVTGAIVKSCLYDIKPMKIDTIVPQKECLVLGRIVISRDLDAILFSASWVPPFAIIVLGFCLLFIFYFLVGIPQPQLETGINPISTSL